MARYIFTLLAALAAQQVAAVPVVFPSSLLPSLTVTDIPIPTGARLDHIPHVKPTRIASGLSLSLALPTCLPSLSLSFPTSIALPTPTTSVVEKRSLSVPIGTATGIPSGLPPPPPPPSGFPSGPLPTGPAPTGAPKYPGGLLQPDHN